jgi:hypothetical protein
LGTTLILNYLFIVHAVATFFMSGIIWFVQVVHYPLFGRVHEEKFLSYEQENMRKTTWVVVPPMVVELLTGTLLLWKRPEFVPSALAWIGFVLLAVIWSSTAIWQAPKHKLLSFGYDQKIHHSLVATNWVRTIAWTARVILTSTLLVRM